MIQLDSALTDAIKHLTGIQKEKYKPGFDF